MAVEADVALLIEEYRCPGGELTLDTALRAFLWRYSPPTSHALFFEGPHMRGMALVCYYQGRSGHQFHAVRNRNVLVVKQIAMLPLGGNKVHLAVLKLFQDPTLERLDAVVVEAVMSDAFLTSLERRGWQVQGTSAIMHRDVAQERVGSALGKVQAKFKKAPEPRIAPLPPIPSDPPKLVRNDGPEAYGWVAKYQRCSEDEAELAGLGYPTDCTY